MGVRRFFTAPLRVLRQHGLLYVLKYIYQLYGPRRLRWRYVTFRIRRLYFTAQSKRPKIRTLQNEDALSEEVVAYGLSEVARINDAHAKIYESKRHRFLFNIPPPSAGAQHFYFLDLADCLEHTGLPVYRYSPLDGGLERVLADFRPSVYIAGEQPSMHAAHPEIASLRQYKERFGLARLYVPYYRTPLKAGSVSSGDSERITLHRNRVAADAFISYFEPVFWELFCPSLRETGLSYHSIPFAANPFRHYPVRSPKEWDWAIATSNGEGTRAELTFKYMRKIIREYNGRIAGFYWGAGINPVPAKEVAQFFSRARISPSIACESNVRYPIDCGAKIHELSAMGVFQIASEMDVLRQYYSHTEIVGFRTPEEFNALFDYFVDKPEVRQIYIRNGIARTFSENTYFQRIRKLIEILDEQNDLF
jgi:hypothetical protein